MENAADQLPNENNKSSFGAWLFSKQEMLEKTVGLGILFLEIVHHFDLFYGGKDEQFLTTLLNLFFLVFIYFVLRKELPRRYELKDNDQILNATLKLNRQHHKKEIDDLVFKSNVFISQLRNILYFILAEAALYLLLLAEVGAKKLAGNGPFRKLLKDTVRMTNADIRTSSEIAKSAFHVSFDLCSYLGAFFLLRCFFVMYLPTIDKEGNDVLNKKTRIFLGALVALMVFDVLYMGRPEGPFTTEFICGVVNSVVFILFIARFENRILDIPPFILCILYIYAILQTSLPFVTGDSELVKVGEHANDGHSFVDEFKGIVLTICLVGKVALSAVLLYVLNTGRIFYYFIILRKRFEEEERNWDKLSKLLEIKSPLPHSVQVEYLRNTDGSYTAMIPKLTNGKVGRGKNETQAWQDLVRKLKRN